MAKAAPRGGRGRSAGTGLQSDADRIIDAALARMASDGWRHLSLAAIADSAELPIVRVYRTFGSKQAILRGLHRRIDEAALAELPPAEPAERPRDRLFDLLMRRFDTLRPYKPALEVLRRELPGEVERLRIGGRCRGDHADPAGRDRDRRKYGDGLEPGARHLAHVLRKRELVGQEEGV